MILSVGVAHPAATLLSLIRLGRPKFLLGGIALFGLGTLMASLMGYGFEARAYVWGQLAVAAIQLMTHYSNDYFDLEADTANHYPTHWSGGSRVLVHGELPRWSALAAAFVFIAVAFGAMIALFMISVALHALILLTIMLLLSWSYSSPPLRLHTRGFGELAVAIVVPLLTPLSGFVLQAGEIRILPILLTLPLVCLQLAMLLTLQVPDEDGDRSVGKLTWTVLFGVRPIILLSTLLIITAFGLGISSSMFGLPSAVGLAWLCLTPLGSLQLLSYLRRDFLKPAAFNRLAFCSTALFFLAIVADIFGLLVTSDPRVAL